MTDEQNSNFLIISLELNIQSCESLSLSCSISQNKKLLNQLTSSEIHNFDFEILNFGVELVHFNFQIVSFFVDLVAFRVDFSAQLAKLVIAWKVMLSFYGIWTTKKSPHQLPRNALMSNISVGINYDGRNKFHAEQYLMKLMNERNRDFNQDAQIAITNLTCTTLSKNPHCKHFSSLI